MKTRLMFARVCVEFSGDSPMLESILIEDEIGMKYEQRVAYEWKPPHCLKCGVFGHNSCVVEEGDSGNSLKKKIHEDPVVCFPATETTPLPPISNPIAAEKELISSCSSGEERGLDDGWQVFRARKKKSSGSGTPPCPKTRTHAHLVNGKFGGKAGGGSVSNPHWSKTGLGTSGQVSQPPLTPLMENFSNCQSGHGKDTCLPTNLETAKNGMDSNGPQPATDVHMRQKGLNVRGPPPSSSAGHTPFPSRLSLMARDLRLGKLGSGSKFRPKPVAGDGVTSAGLGIADQTHKATHLGSLGWAVAGCNGPGLHLDEQPRTENLRNAIKPSMARDDERTADKGPHLVMHSSRPLEQNHDNGSTSGTLDSPMQQVKNSNSMGCEETTTQRTKGEKLDRDIGYHSDLESARM